MEVLVDSRRVEVQPVVAMLLVGKSVVAGMVVQIANQTALIQLSSMVWGCAQEGVLAVAGHYKLQY